eukprot:3283670-Amphidinium_carterae.1
MLVAKGLSNGSCYMWNPILAMGGSPAVCGVEDGVRTLVPTLVWRLVVGSLRRVLLFILPQ